MATAVASPPPMHSEATPRRRPYFSSAASNVTRIRAPEAPIGWPSAQAPAAFATAPIGAIRRLLERTGWAPGTVDLFEINEAFAVVAMAAMRDLDLPHDKVNVNGGACALGHPIGASGARILVTLLSALKARGLKRGVASLCIGGGEATAVAVERAN